jgi:transcriptional regulator with XRE-family HTH domain
MRVPETSSYKEGAARRICETPTGLSTIPARVFTAIAELISAKSARRLRERGGMAKRSPDPIDVEVGRRIRLQRLTRGLSQTELGGELGVTFQQVQKYEKGVNRVGAGRLSRIAVVLDTSVTALLGGADNAQSQDGKSGQRLELEYLVVPGALRLVQAYGRVRETELRRALVELVERMAPADDAGEA